MLTVKFIYTAELGAALNIIVFFVVSVLLATVTSVCSSYYCNNFILLLFFVKFFFFVKNDFSLLKIFLWPFSLYNTMVRYVYLIIMSHSLLWRHIVLLTVGVYSSNHRVLYIIGISMTRRFKKSVGPSVRL